MFITAIPSILDIVPAPHPVPPLDPLPLCPAPLPGGGGDTPIPPLTPALGVAPGRGLNHLRDEHSGAEDCTGTVYESCSSQFWSVHGFYSYTVII